MIRVMEKQMSATVSDSRDEEFAASAGWLNRFLHRNNFTYRRMPENSPRSWRIHRVFPEPPTLLLLLLIPFLPPSGSRLQVPLTAVNLSITVQSDIPQPCEEELLEFEEDLREFIALRAARKKVQPNVVQTVRHPRTVQEDMLYKYLRVAKCYIEKYEHYASSYCPKSVSETDSIISSVSVKSDSSMYEPLSFNPQKIQSQLTEEISRCSVCEEAVKDPVPLPCGHRSCKQCVLSFRDQNGSAADYPCKKCGKRSETDQDLQSVLLEKKIKRVEMETEKFQAEKEKFLAEKEKFQAEKEKSQPEKETFQPEKETFQAEKEMFQAEKEKFQAEKERFQAEKEKSQPEKETFQPEKETFQAEKDKFQAEKEIFELEKRKSSLTLEIQSLEQKGIYTNYDQGVVIPKTRIPYI